MKKLILFTIISLAFNKLKSQSQSWQHLTTGISGYSGQYVTKFVNAFTVYNGKLIVGGGFGSAGGNLTADIAAWNGTNWSTLNTGIQGGFATWSGVKALTVYGTDLIAAGSFSAANTTTLANIAKWDGTSWSSIASSMSVIGMINALTIYNSKLIAAGRFTNIGGTTVQNIAQWDGTNWTPIGAGIPSIGNGNIESLVVFNAELYAAGTFTNAGGVPVNNIAKWNGSTWSSVGTGIPNCNSGNYDNIPSLCVYNNELYAGNCTAGISKWNGSSWVTVGGGTSPVGLAGVHSMVVYNNKLIVGGGFSNAGLDNITNVAAWDGSTWTYVGGNPLYASMGNNGLDDVVYALAVFNNCLYAGGEFTGALDFPQITNLNHVASYCGTVGIEEYQLANPVSISPNPSNGQFTFSGLVGENKIEVMDITGRVLLTEKVNADKYILKVDAAQGIYFYKITDRQNRVQQGKLLIQ